jgi:riboflavin kinase/FMN adenylyltransferase
MRIYRGVNSIPDGMSTVVSVGKFDGVHLGHREIIKEVSRRARTLRCQSAVVTFDPHPSVVIRRTSPLAILTSLPAKLRLLAMLGLNVVIVLPFTHELAETSADVFVRHILVEKLGVKEVHEGRNFRFGKSASAGWEYLLEAGVRYGFGVQIHEPVLCGEHCVSSSAIRSQLADGNYGLASMMLAQPLASIERNWKVCDGPNRLSCG